MDSWFSSVENFEHILKAKKHFVAALKNNRLIALSQDHRRQGRFVRIESLALSDKHTARGRAQRPRKTTLFSWQFMRSSS